jgi:hypothetical protein
MQVVVAVFLSKSRKKEIDGFFPGPDSVAWSRVIFIQTHPFPTIVRVSTPSRSAGSLRVFSREEYQETQDIFILSFFFLSFSSPTNLAELDYK